MFDFESVERAVVGALGEPTGRASVAFVGVQTLEVVRFGPGGDGLVRYVTLGMSRHPMTGAEAPTQDAAGPRAELVLTVREPVDGVLRSLAVLAAMPVVEGVVVRAGAAYELGGPLWPGSPFTGVVTSAGAGIEGPVEFLAVVPVSPSELAYRREHGPAALDQLWTARGVDVRDPWRDGTADARD
ncbi:MAG: hypothetical protein JWO79_3634 [Actinomycetia bacterium]|jgi:hypothetical protein|nr:hypothetical protein [Actinomycetes bacterium]MDQ1657450.1 hypothetical protein [Cryptosporangiaceae bacterium]